MKLKEYGLHKSRCPECWGNTRYSNKDSYKRIKNNDYKRECVLCGWKEQRNMATGFLGTFVAVFMALILSKIAEEAYKRWFDQHVKKGFDKVEEKALQAKNELKKL